MLPPFATTATIISVLAYLSQLARQDVKVDPSGSIVAARHILSNPRMPAARAMVCDAGAHQHEVARTSVHDQGAHLARAAKRGNLPVNRRASARRLPLRVASRASPSTLVIIQFSTAYSMAAAGVPSDGHGISGKPSMSAAARVWHGTQT